MVIFQSKQEEFYVDAIEEGKIIKVTETYAKREGLPILRRLSVEESPKPKNKEEEPHLSFEDFRRPLQWKNSQVYSELAPNFQWEISKRRRQLGITRKHLADAIGESETTIKLIENGALPKDDFIIINKLQEYLKINLRDDKKDFTQSPRSLLTENNEQNKEPQKTESIIGEDIKLIEDD